MEDGVYSKPTKLSFFDDKKVKYVGAGLLDTFAICGKLKTKKFK
jgi:hypothetical protein